METETKTIKDIEEVLEDFVNGMSIISGKKVEFKLVLPKEDLDRISEYYRPRNYPDGMSAPQDHHIVRFIGSGGILNLEEETNKP